MHVEASTCFARTQPILPRAFGTKTGVRYLPLGNERYCLRVAQHELHGECHAVEGQRPTVSAQVPSELCTKKTVMTSAQRGGG